MLNTIAKGIKIGWWALVIGLLFALATYGANSPDYKMVPPAHSTHSP